MAALEYEGELIMAVDITTPNVGMSGYFLNATSVDVSGVEVLKAGVAGKSIYVDHITLNSTDAIALSIGEGETTPGTVDTVLIGPIEFSALQTIQWNFLNGGMVLTENTSLVIDADGAGVICCFVSGRVK